MIASHNHAQAAPKRRRRPAIRSRDVAVTLELFKQSGLTPTAFDMLPDGTCRWHFTPPATSDSNELDDELERWKAKHGQG